MKLFLCLIGLSVLLQGAISFSRVIQTSASISDMVVREGKIYVATDGAGVEILETHLFKKVGRIVLPLITKGEGKSFFPKVYSVDHYQKSTVMVTESGGDFRNVYVAREGKIRKIIDTTWGFLIKKVRFIDQDHVLLGLSGDTMVLMDITKNTLVYHSQAGGGVLRDMALSPSKSLVAIADEGGEITMLDVHTGRHVKTLRGINVDNINRIDYQKNTIISAGQDRRVGLYRAQGSYYLERDFFVYAVGLSPSSLRGVYTNGTENDLEVFDTMTKRPIAALHGGGVILDTLIFLDEHRLIGAGEENKIYYWRLP